MAYGRPEHRFFQREVSANSLIRSANRHRPASIAQHPVSHLRFSRLKLVSAAHTMPRRRSLEVGTMAVEDSDVNRAVQQDPGSQRVQVRRAALASTIGTTIEWYDFFLYNTAAALVFGKVFFGSSEIGGVLLAFSTQFVGFAARPVGAAIFGHVGDKIGRKRSLVATLLVMGICTVLIGLLPTYEAIGLA